MCGYDVRKSQKTLNLKRDARATLLFEDGVQYDQIRGVMIKYDVELIHETGDVRAIGIELFTKYGDGNPPAGRSYR